MDAEAEGFAQFVEARQRALQRTAWLLTGDWAVAEDLVQTALVRAWPRWERIRRRDDPEVYVRRAMVNTWASGAAAGGGASGPPSGARHPGSRGRGDRGDRAHRRAGRAAALTARQRAVLVLRVLTI